MDDDADFTLEEKDIVGLNFITGNSSRGEKV